MKRLALIWGASSSKDAAEVGAAVWRSLDYPEAKGLRQNVVDSLSEADQWSPDGLVRLGRFVRIQMDHDRMNRILNKLVRGLFFKVTSMVLPEEYIVGIHLSGRSPDLQEYRKNERHLLDWPETVIGDRAFMCRFTASREDICQTVCRFGFYDTVTFMGYTMKLTSSNGGGMILVLKGPPEQPEP